jgi:hypothetical protein
MAEDRVTEHLVCCQLQIPRWARTRNTTPSEPRKCPLYEHVDAIPDPPVRHGVDQRLVSGIALISWLTTPRVVEDSALSCRGR